MIYSRPCPFLAEFECVVQMGVFLLIYRGIIHFSFTTNNSMLYSGEKKERAAELSYERRILIAQALYAFAVVLCVISTYVSTALTILVRGYYAIAPRIRLFDRF